MTGVRLSEAVLKEIRRWASKQDDKPSKAEAIRRLVELGLKAKGKR
jgi:hypothetical protein